MQIWGHDSAGCVRALESPIVDDLYLLQWTQAGDVEWKELATQTAGTVEYLIAIDSSGELVKWLCSGTGKQVILQENNDIEFHDWYDIFPANKGVWVWNEADAEPAWVTGTTNQVLTQVGTTGSGTAVWEFRSPAPANVPRGYINGLEVNQTGTTDEIEVSVGVARDNSNAFTHTLVSAMVKDMASAWVAGSTNGGWDGTNSGNLPTSGTVHIFTISDGSTTDVIGSVNVVPTLPAGYTSYRRIASRTTDGSANIRPVYQFDRYSRYSSVSAFDINTTSASTTNTLVAFDVPIGVNLKIEIQTYASARINWQDADATSLASDAGVSTAPPASDGSTTSINTSNAFWTNTAAQIKYVASGASTLRASAFGWYDPLTP